MRKGFTKYEIGKEIGNLTITKRLTYNSSAVGSSYLFSCVCGKTVKRRLQYLLNNKINSCGCLKEKRVYLPYNQSWNFRGYEDICLTFWNIVVKGAKDREIEFDITIQYAWEIFLEQNKKCALTGIDLYFSSKARLHDGNISLDRKDSSKGYTVGNIQWVEKRLNIMKNRFPEEEFIKLCVLVAKHKG